MAKRSTETKPGPETVLITAARDGLYCCGVVHTAAPRRFPRAHFTPEQLQELRDHPELTVEEVS